MDDVTVNAWLDNDYYADLGVPRDASRAEIATSYRRLARAHHPDTSTDADPDTFTRVQRAFEVLGHDETRAHYDEVHRVVRHLQVLADRRAADDEADAWIPAYTNQLRLRVEFAQAVNPWQHVATPWQAFAAWNPWLAAARG